MKNKLQGIKNIIFDLGGVILNLDFNATILAFRKLGFKTDVLGGGFSYSDEIFHRLQTGQATPEEFRQWVRETLKKHELKDKEIDDAWCAMLKGIPRSRIDTIKQLKENYNVYLFSNTNKIHIDFLEEEFLEKNGFPFTSIFDKVYYSQEIFDAKPAVSSFIKVIEHSGANPAETLFIDDIEENIAGAEKAGLKTFWFKDGLELSEVF